MGGKSNSTREIAVVHATPAGINGVCWSQGSMPGKYAAHGMYSSFFLVLTLFRRTELTKESRTKWRLWPLQPAIRCTDNAADWPKAAVIGPQQRISDFFGVIQICDTLSTKGELLQVAEVKSFPAMPKSMRSVNRDRYGADLKMWSILLVCTILPIVLVFFFSIGRRTVQLYIHSIICLWLFDHLLLHLREAEGKLQIFRQRKVRTPCQFQHFNGDNLRQKKNEKCEFGKRESVNSSPTSTLLSWRPFFSLSLAVSPSLSLSLSLTHFLIPSRTIYQGRPRLIYYDKVSLQNHVTLIFEHNSTRYVKERRFVHTCTDNWLIIKMVSKQNGRLGFSWWLGRQPNRWSQKVFNLSWSWRGHGIRVFWYRVY